MPRKNRVVGAVIIIVILVAYAFVYEMFDGQQNNQKLQMAFPSAEKLSNVTGSNMSALKLTNQSVNIYPGENRSQVVQYYNNTALIFLEISVYNSTSAAQNGYWNETSIGLGSNLQYTNESYDGFVYSYFYNNRTASSNSNTWWAWGTSQNYFFYDYGQKSSILRNNLTGIVKLQIDTME